MLKTKVYFDNKKVYQNTHEIKEHRLFKENNSFMLKFVLLKPSFTSINCNDESNNHSFQTISNSCLIS